MLRNALEKPGHAALQRDDWRHAVVGRLDALDWKAVLADLRPFVEHQADLDMLSKEAIRKLLERA